MDLKGLPHEIVDEIDLRAAQKPQGDWIDQHDRTLAGQLMVVRRSILGDFEGVLVS
jgi:hypothetical protein